LTKVLGVNRLKKKLQSIPSKSRPAIRAALAKSADDMVAMMKRLAPVDSGDLRDSIGWTWGTQTPDGTVAFATSKFSDPDLTITIYAGDDKAFYTRWVEFGTTQNPAHPFFFTSYRASRKSAKSRIKRAVNKAARDSA
jgi:HK97 gp10 family phage protein